MKTIIIITQKQGGHVLGIRIGATGKLYNNITPSSVLRVRKHILKHKYCLDRAWLDHCCEHALPTDPYTIIYRSKIKS